jgi:hypothetical protein
MSQPDLDPVEREALAYIVRELEAGTTHVLTDTFLPFLKSVDAGDRLVAILKYFEALEILTPESPPGNRWKLPPLIGRVIPAYWRIEGKAVILHRALLDQQPGEHKSPKEGKRRRGRPGDTDARADQKIWDAWRTGEHKDYADLARLLGKSAREVARAIDRHRHRRARGSANRRTKSPDR